jgi:hypothetical protein
MLLVPLLLASRFAFQAQDTLSPAAQRALADLRYLAADAREGRGVGTKGLEDAGLYLAAAFKKIGLAPGASANSYLQSFTIAADAPAALRTDAGGKTIRNVIGMLRGRDRARRGEVIVIGAHYDHLGYGGFGALDPDSTGKVHNGADDNASGTTALLEVARRLKTRHLARTVVFVAFSGEELGDLGSAYFVKHPTDPVDSIYTMLNLDMVGRLRNAKLIVLGAATTEEYPALLDSLNHTATGAPRFDLRASGDGWGPSDHASFYAVNRPVLHFFTDLHEDYHRSTDDVERINIVGLEQVADYVADVASALANRTGALTFVAASQPQASTTGSGYGAYLGTVPDMTESPGGVRISATRAGSPAEQAGLKGGDIITAIGAQTVANLEDMAAALRAHQPGDTVVIVVKRDTTALRLTAVLGRRGS